MQDRRKYGRQILFDSKIDGLIFVLAEADTGGNNRRDGPGGGQSLCDDQSGPPPYRSQLRHPSNFAFDAQAAPATPLPTVLAGVEILLNGQPTPISFASPNQVNAQIPPGTPTGNARVQARVDGKVSAEITLAISPSSPGIFFYGDNRAVVQNQDGGINGLYLTGIGATTVSVGPGAPSPVDPLALAVNVATLQIGDSQAHVLLTGLTPGFVGLAQINFQVPELAAGDYPLTVNIDAVRSNSPLFRIGNP